LKVVDLTYTNDARGPRADTVNQRPDKMILEISSKLPVAGIGLPIGDSVDSGGPANAVTKGGGDTILRMTNRARGLFVEK